MKIKIKLKELFYIPNVLEYIRIYFLILGLIYFNINYFYINFILDIIDGPIARYLNQTSEFGCFLDHFVDRLTITSPAILLIYKGKGNLFLYFIIVEAFSNIYFNYIKSSKHMKHKKKIDNWIINYYYSNNRWNLLSYCSLIPYFLYAPMVYCNYINELGNFILKSGVFLYFIIFTQKLKYY